MFVAYRLHYVFSSRGAELSRSDAMSLARYFSAGNPGYLDLVA